MIVKKYKAILKNIEHPIEGIYTLTFSSENGKFKYNPGQFLHLALDTDYDGIGQWPESRCFSIQTSPEQDDIKITYAVKGKFTRQMEKSLRTGAKIWLKLPYGDLFTRPHDKNHTVFISGGTGITPFLSLFTDASFAQYTHPVLYTGFKSETFNIYEEELQKTLQINPAIKIQRTYEKMDGMLNIHDIFNENGQHATYFISGPPMMIKTFKNYLSESGVVADNILTDDWE